MSLVAYGMSDESDDDEEEMNVIPAKPKCQVLASNVNDCTENGSKSNGFSIGSCNVFQSQNDDELNEVKVDFHKIPKPKPCTSNQLNAFEEDGLLPNKVDYGVIEKPKKKNRGPVQIMVPSLKEFNEPDDSSSSQYNPKYSADAEKKSGLIAALPPPKNIQISKSNSMIPHVLTNSKAKTAVTQAKSSNIKKPVSSLTQISSIKSSFCPLSSYDSDDEIDQQDKPTTDFFSLLKSDCVEDNDIPMETNYVDCARIDNLIQERDIKHEEKTLVSTVMNLPKEEIISKNKVDVGPKLPVPEQEYHVDNDGNVAFDDKAIEYLCGRRGVKRKNELNVDIIDIHGDDIKPDERDWMVKALTEEPVQRPLSMYGSGPGGTSKRKHQITYLAHQAKAMELELKNQWAQNRATKQQTRSKYGF